MSDEKERISVQDQEGSGNIHVVPEILVAIAERNTLNTKGVIRMAETPSTRTRKQENTISMNGVQLELAEGGAIFDLYVIMDGNHDLMAVARQSQSAIMEGVAQMVGTPVQAVNVHIEDAEFPELAVSDTDSA